MLVGRNVAGGEEEAANSCTHEGRKLTVQVLFHVLHGSRPEFQSITFCVRPLEGIEQAVSVHATANNDTSTKIRDRCRLHQGGLTAARLHFHCG